jgi:chromosome partitioning protein
VLSTYLSSSVKIRESHEVAQPMIHYAPGHKITGQFVALHSELAQVDSKAGGKARGRRAA